MFAVVSSGSATAPLASAETPNVLSDLVLPPTYLTRRESAGLPFPVLQSLWQRAGATYGIPWQVLGAINKVESNFGSNMGPSSAGAIGWMQFMPSTWERWGMDANGDGVSDPWNPDDAIFAAARYLAAAGGRTDLARGIFAYNHAQWYVDQILALARQYGQNGFDIPFTYDRNQANVQAAETAIATQNRVVDRATLQEGRLARRTQVMYARAAAAPLLSSRLALEKRAFQVGARRDAATASVVAAKRKLKAAEKALEQARVSALTSFTSGVGLIGAPIYQGDYVFPVGGGPSVVSVGHYHHDYPAADIAAPAGSPLYALTDGFIVDAWPTPNGNCGIGLTIRAAGDGRMWTYCHMSYQRAGNPARHRRCGRPARRSRRLDGTLDRPAPSSPASAGELLPAGRALVRRLRGHCFPLAGRADYGCGARLRRRRRCRSSPLGRSRGDHVHGRKVLTPWPSLPKSEVWLCGSVSSSPGFL